MLCPPIHPSHPYISVFFLFFFSIYFQFIDLRLVFICSIGHIYIIRVVSTISDLHTMLSHRLVVLFQSQLAYTEDLKHPNYYVCQNKLEIVVEATNIRRFWINIEFNASPTAHMQFIFWIFPNHIPNIRNCLNLSTHTPRKSSTDGRNTPSRDWFSIIFLFFLLREESEYWFFPLQFLIYFKNASIYKRKWEHNLKKKMNLIN